MLETIKKKKEKEQMMADSKEQLIDNEDSTNKAKKVARKKELLKAQIQLRKTLFRKKIHIPSTKGGKSVPLDQLHIEIFIDMHTQSLHASPYLNFKW